MADGTQQQPIRHGETALTATIVDHAAGDPGFTRSLARALLDAAAAQAGAPGRHARQLLPHLPRAHIELSGQHRHPHIALRSLFYKIGESKIDWLFAGPSGFALAVEVKINPRTGFQPKQIKRYSEVLRSERHLRAGVLAVTVKPPERADLLHPSNGRNLGFVLWSELEPSLRRLTARDHGEWHRTLDTIMALQCRP